METTLGSLGLRIPVQSLTSSDKLVMTPAGVMAWRNRLPMADTGATASKVYHAIRDCNMVELSIRDRFQILELLRTPVQYISQSLRRHYLNQTAPLNEQKLTIVQLAQTLQLEMANGYKIIIEQLAAKSSPDEYKTMMPEALEQVLHYFSHVLLRCYHLYSSAPPELWKEFYILYQYAEKHGFDQGTVLDGFKQILIMAVTDPYKWRHSELDALFNVSRVWTKDTTIRKGSQNKNPGFYVFDFTQDKPPFSPTFAEVKDEKKSRLFDVTQLVSHLKSLLAVVEPNELKARLEHSYDPEYALSLPVLHGIIQEWETVPKRESERKETKEHVRVCIGLSAVHYYLSKERPFLPQANLESNLAATSELSIQEMPAEPKVFTSETVQKESEVITVQFESPQKSADYPSFPAKFPSVHPALEINQSDEGYCLVWEDNSYPPIQAGELLGIEIEAEGAKKWTVAVVRWLKHFDSELRLGMRLLSNKLAEAAAAQIIKEDKGAGYYLRCLILDTGILTPTIPFKVGSEILILHGDGTTEEAQLLKLRSATGSYKLFDYTKSKDLKPEVAKIAMEAKSNIPSEPKKPKGPKGGDPFDSIWTHL